MKLSIFAIAVLLLAAACNTAPDPGAREVFDAQGQQVITTWANRPQHFLAILYGNAAARKSAFSDTIPAADAAYTLVTWEQTAHKYWYGSYINGNIRSVEQVRMRVNRDGAVTPVYQLLRGTISGPGSNTASRIKWILSQQPVVFP